MMPEKGQSVKYRAIAGELYDAVVLHVLPVTGIAVPRVDIDVTLPGVRDPWRLSAVRWSDDPHERDAGARPRSEQ